MKLLIVEDNLKLANYLKQGLSEASYVVDLANDGVDGLHYALTENYDLIILDIMIPKLDGFSVLKTIRLSGNNKPILLLSARDQVSDRVKGLEMGADDYLIKPFDFSELLARCKILLRRSNNCVHNSDVIKVADLSLDVNKRYVTRGNKRIDLTAKEFSLLELLMTRNGDILPRALIASQIWDMNFDCDTNIIDVAIRRLRSKIDDNYDNKLIHTIRGMGYVLENKQK